ncbi:uncharacterized protein [Henckelia pumila]|uniref:uncharacterized protein n=1 Tax=Henckelia pumila TaxID=405737 RepID=UPI003C6E0AEB
MKENEKVRVGTFLLCGIPAFVLTDTGFHPIREVEFGIDLMQGTSRILRAQYRLAPSEMRELMNQLQDHLDMGYIQPRASCTNIVVIRAALRAKKPELLTVILPQNLKKQPPESQELLNLHFLCPLDNSDHFVDSPYISVQTMENQIKELERQGSSVASEVELERLKCKRQQSAEMIRKWERMYKELHQVCVEMIVDGGLTEVLLTKRMDKEWMSKSRLSREYEHGVEYFLKFAIKNAEDREAISCPCTKCGNLKKKKVETIRAHMYSNDIDLTYHTWIWHGERSAMKNSNNDRDQEREDVPKFDAEEPIDMVHAAFDSYAENPTTFKNLLEDAEKPLYPGCSKFTRLSAVVKLFNLKAKYSWSDKSCTDLLNLLGEMLPDDNKLPLSFYDAKKSLCALGITYEKIHACPNDCILYRKEYEDMNSCPTCGMSRWKMGQKDTIKEGVPAKVLWYFPPIPRFVRMFRNKEFSKELTWHADKRLNDGYLRHPADAPSWKLVDHKWPNFAADSRNLRLAISADGINPHGMMSSTYSCWPVLMITYNLPPWLCMKRKFMMLTMLISGPKQPGNDIDVYLAPLIDDLKFLWDIGVEAYDAYRQETFSLRAVLLWTINDFPAYGNISGCIVKGYHACPICGEETYSTRLKHSRKMSYTGHRRFLPANHLYRRQRKAFNGYQEFNPAPKPLSGDEVLKKVDGIHCHWGKMRKKIQSTKDDVKPSFKTKSIFFELEYWKHLYVRHVLDVMHIEKNICESLLGTLLDIPGKTKDGIAARLDLAEMNLRTDLAPVMGEKKSFLPAACYTLTKDEKRKILNSLCGMQLPTCYSSNVKNFVSMKDLKLVGLKSHDYHTLMQQLLPVAIRGVLPKHVRDSITRLCFFFNELCNKVMDPSKLDELQREIVIILCLLEKYFPPSFFDIMIHLTVHLVREVARVDDHSTYQVSERLKWMARGPSKQVLKYSSYLIDGVTYATRERDDMRVVQNSGVSLVAKIMQVSTAKDKHPIVSDMVFYGVIQEIWVVDYHKFQIPMFKCNWVENSNGIKVDDLGFTLVNLHRIGYKSDSFILASQAKQVFYIEAPEDPLWSVVLATPCREYFEYTKGEELEETAMHYHSSSRGLAPMDVDVADDNEPCIREDCDGIWVENN